MSTEQSSEKVSTQGTGEPIEKKAWCILWDFTKITKVGANWELGFKNYSKMILFLKNNEFSIEDFQYYMSLPQARLETEEYIYYKVRKRFQDALLKYRQAVKNIIFYKAMTKAMEKLKKEQEEKAKLEGSTKTEATIPDRGIIINNENK